MRFSIFTAVSAARTSPRRMPVLWAYGSTPHRVSYACESAYEFLQRKNSCCVPYIETASGLNVKDDGKGLEMYISGKRFGIGESETRCAGTWDRKPVSVLRQLQHISAFAFGSVRRSGHWFCPNKAVPFWCSAVQVIL